MKARWLTVLAAGCFVIHGGVARGQQPQPKPEEGWEASVGAQSNYVWGDYEDSSGDLDVLITDAAIKLEGPAWKGSLVTVRLNYEQRHYDFDGPQPFFAGLREPWVDVNTAGVGVRLIQAITDRWGFLVGGVARASAGADAEIFDGVSGAVLAGVGYDFGGGFIGGIGALGLFRFEEDVVVVPAIQFRWDVDDRWRVSLEGTRFEIRFRPHREWTLTGGAAFDGIRFRLQEGAVDESIVEDRRLFGFFGVAWRPRDWIEINAEVGLDFWREIQIEDQDGDNDRDFDFDLAPFVGLGATLHF